MKITRKNYEAFFLDYYENSLSPEQVAELMVFLEDNPELKEEFYEFEDAATLSPDISVTFARKSDLKKKDILPVGKINGTNYEEFFVASLEGDINDDDNRDVVTFLKQNPHTKLEYNILRSTFLKPDKTIVYKDKESLKKRGVLIALRPALLYAVSIAASVLIFLGIYLLINNRNIPQRENLHIARMEIILPDTESDHSSFPEMIVTASVSNPLVAKVDDDTEFIRTERTAAIVMLRREMTTLEIENNVSAAIDLSGLEATLQNPTSDIANANPVKEHKEKPFFSRFLASLIKKAIPARPTGNKSLIEYTVNGYNLLTDRDVQIEKQYDENGNLVAYNVIGNNIEIVKRVKTAAKE